MFENVLSPQSFEFVRKFKVDVLPPHSYLGGGTAAALQLGHRKSADLDFFTKEEFVEHQWQQKLEKEIRFKLIKSDWQTLIGVAHGVKVSIFGYKYKLIGHTLGFLNVKIASLPDLAAMKLDTIITRGAKRDFVDLYFLSQKYGLETMFEFYQRKYGNFDEKEIMVKKALIYFTDADKEEMPEMLNPINWNEIKDYFLSSIKI